MKDSEDNILSSIINTIFFRKSKKLDYNFKISINDLNFRIKGFNPDEHASDFTLIDKISIIYSQPQISIRKETSTFTCMMCQQNVPIFPNVITKTI